MQNNANRNASENNSLSESLQNFNGNPENFLKAMSDKVHALVEDWTYKFENYQFSSLKLVQ